MELDRRRTAAGLATALAGFGPAFAESAGADSLPVATDELGRMVAEVFLDGRGPYRFAVDTGANRTTVADDVAGALDLPPGPTLTINGIAGAYAARSVRVETLTIGARNAGPFTAPVLPRRGLGADGLIGTDALAGRRLTLDLAGSRLRLDSGGGRRPRSGAEPGRAGLVQIALPARQRPGRLMTFVARAGGRGVVCFVDSGAPVSVGNRRLLAAVRGRDTAPAFEESTAVVRGATGHAVPATRARVPTLRLGGLDVTHLDVPFADLHTFRGWDLDARPALLLGMDFLRVFDEVELDYAASAVLFRFSEKPGGGRVRRAEEARP